MKRLAFSAIVFLAGAGIALAQAADNYPAGYGKMIEAAKAEGKVVVYGTFDPEAYQPLVDGFNAKFPGVTVEFNSMSSTPMYSRFISEVAAGGATADVLFSSAMDLQVKLITDGYGMEYASAEAGSIPEWASWNKIAYAATIDPVTFIYNKSELKPEQVPQTHAEVAEKLKAHKETYQDRVVTYDAEKSGVGFLYLTQDLKTMGDNIWDTYRAMRDVGGRVGAGTSNIIESVASGENVFAYNQLGGYARPIAANNPDLGILLPKDFTFGTMRVMFVTKAAAHPNAAKLFIDYVLSKDGQTVLVNESQAYSIRTDMEGEASVGGLQREIGDALKPIPMHAELLEMLEPAKRTDILARWKEAFQGTK